MTTTTRTDAATGAILVAGRPVAAYTDLRDARACNGHSLDNLVGYVVRRTITPDGDVLWHDDAHTGCGVDVAVTDGANRYAEALRLAELLRLRKGYAVVDQLFGCGHRSC